MNITYNDSRPTIKRNKKFFDVSDDSFEKTIRVKIDTVEEICAGGLNCDESDVAYLLASIEANRQLSQPKVSTEKYRKQNISEESLIETCKLLLANSYYQIERVIAALREMTYAEIVEVFSDPNPVERLEDYV